PPHLTRSTLLAHLTYVNSVNHSQIPPPNRPPILQRRAQPSRQLHNFGSIPAFRSGKWQAESSSLLSSHSGSASPSRSFYDRALPASQSETAGRRPPMKLRHP